MSRVWHLVRRFGVSLIGRRPTGEDERWARETLAPSQIDLWARMSPTDRAHAVQVARFAEAQLHDLGPVDPREVLRAALLHDVGKVETGAGVAIRVLATLVGPFVPDDRAGRLARRGGVVGRCGRQLIYPALGAELLSGVGSSTLVTRWAAEHHQSPRGWSVDPRVGALLKAADDAAS